jgi:predicted phosphodiesterase
MKILCTGDLHIGRRPSRIRGGTEDASLSCARRWDDIVDCALTQKVDVVALSGDIIDRENKHFEAIGPLERGIRKLGDQGVITVAVTGNHDYAVLPPVMRTLGSDRFHVVGLGGHWEDRAIETRSGEPLHVHGWSFPQEYVLQDPVESYALSASTGVVTLGLVHGELGVPNSKYAPLSLARLRECPVSFWLLGHLHMPVLSDMPGGPAVLYPGSPQAMDPGVGERGAHGVWIADVTPGMTPHFLFIALSAVRYDELVVDVTGVVDDSALREMVIAAVRNASATMCAGAQGLRVISLRLRVIGMTRLHRDVGRILAGLVTDFEWPTGEVTTYIDKIDVATRPERDLARLATGHDAPAVLARLLQQLDANADTGEMDGSTQDLLRELAMTANDIQRTKAYRSLTMSLDEVNEANGIALREIAALQASRLLDALIAQQEQGVA